MCSTERQHIVEQITEVKIRETLPDQILDQVDEPNWDISPGDLSNGCKKEVYPGQIRGWPWRTSSSPAT